MGDVPERMAAAVLQGAGRLDVMDVPVPEVGPDEVLVAVELCGICGSDLHMVMEGWGAPGSWQGHEWTGRVAAVGDQVTTWREGDAVIGGPPVQLRGLPDVRGRAGVALPRARHPGRRTEPGCVRHLQGGRGW